VFAKTSVVGANPNPVFRKLVTRTGKPPRWKPEDRRVTAQIHMLLVAH
jgi:hypothetical protein